MRQIHISLNVQAFRIDRLHSVGSDLFIPGIGAILLVLSVCLSACGSLPGAASGPKDFGIVAYQGEDVFGGKETNFLQVLGQKKPVVLNFWAGQCPPCRAEMPDFQKVADEFAGKVVFVGIDVGPFTGLGSHDDAKALLTDLGIHYPAAYAVDASALSPYGVKAMPTTVYLSADGKIQATTNGIVREDQLRAELATLLKS
jgi:thiol-disulfide isomerase/thioredoxin